METPEFIIVGAGDYDPEKNPITKTEGSIICAADAGYLALRSVNIMPDIQVGDFDSMDVSEIPDAAETEIITLPVVKDDTDMAYCIKEGFKRGYKQFKLYGALGGTRISHTMANIALLTMIRDMGGNGEIIWGDIRIFQLKGGETETVDGKKGDLLSVFSVSEEITVSLKGLYYPMEKGRISRRFPLGVSNHFTGPKAVVELHKGEALVIVEKGEPIIYNGEIGEP